MSSNVARFMHDAHEVPGASGLERRSVSVQGPVFKRTDLSPVELVSGSVESVYIDGEEGDGEHGSRVHAASLLEPSRWSLLASCVSALFVDVEGIIGVGGRSELNVRGVVDCLLPVSLTIGATDPFGHQLDDRPHRLGFGCFVPGPDADKDGFPVSEFVAFLPNDQRSFDVVHWPQPWHPDHDFTAPFCLSLVERLAQLLDEPRLLDLLVASADMYPTFGVAVR